MKVRYYVIIYVLHYNNIRFTYSFMIFSLKKRKEGGNPDYVILAREIRVMIAY